MKIVSTNMTVADFCDALERGDVTVNRKYQRSDKVWPAVARSYLIETILLDFPIPKMYLYSVTDLKSRRTMKEIVDGQQRSSAIREYFNENFRLTSDVEELNGKTLSELDDDQQQRFLSFSLSFDLFVAATQEEVVEVFRRMNSYTVPLNDEEKRHARFQGKFKWFVNRVAQRFNKFFLDSGLYGEKQLVRMADTKLVAEACDALFYGIRTTNKLLLDRLYQDHEIEFPQERDYDSWITQAIDDVRILPDIAHSSLMKPYIIYALLLSFIYARKPLPSLRPAAPSGKSVRADRDQIAANLLALADALDNPDQSGTLCDFVEACSSKTNTREQRTKRFRWMCRALSTKLVP